MKNTCKNLTFSVFTHISSLFQNFHFTVMSAVLSTPNPCFIKYTVSVIVSELFQYILLWAFSSIQIVHYNITVVLGLKWHSYFMCEHTQVQMKNTCKNLTFSVSTHISSLFQNFTLYSNISGIKWTLIHSIKYTVSVIVSELYQYILLWFF